MTCSSPAPEPSLPGAPGWLRPLGLGLALAAAAGPARAQEPSSVLARTEAGEEIVIYDTLEIQRRRAELEALILDQGYRAGIRKDGRTIYRPQVPWKPSVVVHDDGIVQLTRSPVRWMAPGDPDNLLNNLWCLPPFTPMCVRIGGQVISKTKLDAHKQKVLAQTHQSSEHWRQAIVDKDTWERVNTELPAMMEGAWTRGEPMMGDTPPLATAAERRLDLLRFWATRSDTREGHIVAQVVADFIAYEVQSSGEPVTEDELEQANAWAQGVRVLELDPAPAGPAAPSSEPPEPQPEVQDDAPAAPPAAGPG